MAEQSRTSKRPRTFKAAMVIAMTVGIGVVCAFMPSAQAQQITIRFNHTFGPGTNADQAVKRFGEEIARKSGNRIQVKIFSSGELAEEIPQYNLLQANAIEMALAGPLVPTLTPEYGIVDMLYLWRDQGQIRRFHEGPIGQEIQAKILQVKAIRTLAFINRGARNLTSSKPVRSPADLKGMKIRTLQVPAHIEAWRMLGATPVPMSINEVFVGLQQGVIDAQENPVEMIKAMSFFEVQKYLVKTAHHRGVIWLVASEKFMQSLSADDRRLVQSEAKAAAAYGDQLQEALDASIEKELLAKGMTAIDPDKEAFRNAVKELPAKFAKQWQPGLYEKIRSMP